MLALVDVIDPEIDAAVNERIRVALAPREPLMVPVVNDLIKVALAPNEPLMVPVVNDLTNAALAPNDPEISSAICAELDIVPAAETPVNPDPSPE